MVAAAAAVVAVSMGEGKVGEVVVVTGVTVSVGKPWVAGETGMA